MTKSRKLVDDPWQCVERYFTGFAILWAFRRLESPIRAQETHSAFHPNAQRNTSHRRCASIEIVRPWNPRLRAQPKSQQPLLKLQAITGHSISRSSPTDVPKAPINIYDAHRSRAQAHDAVIRVYEESGNVIETHDHAGDLKEH